VPKLSGDGGGCLSAYRGDGVPMNDQRRAKLEAQGWRLGSFADFLKLTRKQVDAIETKIAVRAPRTGTIRRSRRAAKQPRIVR
jgi:hypothetical protein